MGLAADRQFLLRLRLSSQLAYLTLLRWRYPKQAPGSDTELVIEGYCRSGNSFLAEGFMWAQGRPVRVAWNNHAIAAVRYAADQRIPAVVVIRRPEEVAVSQHLKRPDLSFGAILDGYRIYYSAVLRYAESFVGCTLEEVRDDLGAVIGRLNETYGCGFESFRHDKAAERAIYEVMKRRATPQQGGRPVDTGYPSVERLERRAAVEAAFAEDPPQQLAAAKVQYRAFADSACAADAVHRARGSRPKVVMD